MEITATGLDVWFLLAEASGAPRISDGAVGVQSWGCEADGGHRPAEAFSGRSGQGPAQSRFLGPTLLYDCMIDAASPKPSSLLNSHHQTTHFC